MSPPPPSAPLRPLPAGVPAPGRLRARIVTAVIIALAAAWLFGLTRFLQAAGRISITLPRQAPSPAEEHNLASWRWGPTVQVSSYHQDPFAHHHPAFLVDERIGPSLLEKWGSDPRDPHPWAEITWRQPRTLSRIVLRHAGEYEADSETLTHYTLTCLRDSGAAGPLARDTEVRVSDNKSRIAIHPLPCKDARGVRIDVNLNAPNTMARLYEIEAWGQ
jgi:hypothetical protein